MNANYETSIELKGIHIKSLSSAELSGLLIRDHHQDTMIYVESLNLDLNKVDLRNNSFSLAKLLVSSAIFRMKTYSGESDSNLDIFICSFGESDTSSTSFSLNCAKLDLADAEFLLFVEDSVSPYYQINYDQMKADRIRLSARELRINDSSVKMQIKDLAFRNDFINLNHLESNVSINSDSLDTRNLVILTDRSKLQGDFRMNYSLGFNDFVNDVKLKLRLHNSIVNSDDIAAFTEELIALKMTFKIEGRSSGTVNDLRFKDLVLVPGPAIKLKGRLRNITEPERVSFEALKLSFAGSLDSIPLYPFTSGKSFNLSSYVNHPSQISFDALLNGDLKEVAGYLDLNSDRIDLYSDFKIKALLEDSISLSTKNRVNRMNPKELFGVEDLESMAGNFSLDWKGTDPLIANAKATGSFNELIYRKHRYDSMAFDLGLQKKQLMANLFILDPYGRIVLQSSSKIGEKDFLSQGKIYALGMRPHELNLSADFDSLVVNTRLNYNLKMKGEAISSFQLDMDTVLLKNRNYMFGDRRLNLSYRTGSEDSIELSSTAADLKLWGDVKNISLDDLMAEIQSDIGFTETDTKGDFHNINLQMEVGNVESLLDIFVPGLEVANGTELMLVMDAESRSLSSLLSSEQIAYGAMKLSDFDMSMRVLNRKAKFVMSSSTFSLGDSLSTYDLDLSLEGARDSLRFIFDIDPYRKGELSLSLNSDIGLHESYILFDIDGSELFIIDSLWTIESVAELRLDSSGLLIPLLNASSAGKFLTISGRIGDNYEDKLRVNFKKLNLSNVDQIMGIKEVALKGELSGYVQFRSILKDLQMESDLKFKDLNFNDQVMGAGEFTALWNSENKGLEMKGNFLDNSIPVVWFNGTYFPENKQDQLDFKMLVRDLKLKALEPFLANYISDVSGRLSGDLNVSGSIDEPRIYSNMTFSKTEVKVNYMGAKFYIDQQEAKVRNDWFGFDYIKLKDADGNIAHATATIFHENYSKFNYDINIVSDNFQFLNTTYKDNELYYGTAFLGGDLNVSGFQNELIIDANLQTNKGTRFFIPLEGAEEVTRNDFIVFVKPDSLNVEESYEAKLENIQMNLNVEMTPDAEVQLIFDEIAGDIMKASGNGNIRMGINSLGEFTMFGSYELEQGEYLFTLQNIINKKFELKKGSTIRWNGDPLHANLDVTAVYNTKAQLSDLLQDETLSKRVNTRVNLFMRNHLLKPDLTFGIDFPGVEEAVRSRANVALNNEEQVNRQVFSILLLNSFSPPEGGLQTSGTAGATSSELLANQLSNWMSHLSDKLQISVSELNANNFELGLSRGFFSDRVTIEGNVGVTSTDDAPGTEENTSRLVGDVKVEYKITKDGKLRAKVFNESNDDALVNQQNAKDTQGVGIFYREEFNTWGEFWAKIFGKSGNKKGPEK